MIAAVDELLPPFWSRGNPIDLVAAVSDGVPERIIELVAGCDGVDASSRWHSSAARAAEGRASTRGRAAERRPHGPAKTHWRWATRSES